MTISHFASEMLFSRCLKMLMEVNILIINTKVNPAFLFMNMGNPNPNSINMSVAVGFPPFFQFRSNPSPTLKLALLLKKLA